MDGSFLSNAKAVFAKCKKMLDVISLFLRPNFKFKYRYELDNIIVGRIV